MAAKLRPRWSLPSATRLGEPWPPPRIDHAEPFAASLSGSLGIFNEYSSYSCGRDCRSMSVLRSVRDGNAVTRIEYLGAVSEFDLEFTFKNVSGMTTFTPMRFHL